MAEFILHAGLHKTATTSLQEQVFPQVRQAIYTGKCRQVMGSRKAPILSQFTSFCEDQVSAVDRLPAHTCGYYLSLLQDSLIARLARSKATLDSLGDELSLMKRLVDRIEAIADHPTIFYSCEGLLLSIGHLFPERALELCDRAPLFLHEDLFPGVIRRIVVYLRSPVEYLYSRYIQIHTVRLRASKQFVVAPSNYLNLQARLYAGPMKSQSVFYHAFQRELQEDLASLGPSVVIRSYEKHIKNGKSICREVKKAFRLDVAGHEDVDRSFKDQPLNTTDQDKAEAVKSIVSHMRLSGGDELKQLFHQTALGHSLVQEALSSRIYPY